MQAPKYCRFAGDRDAISVSWNGGESMCGRFSQHWGLEEWNHIWPVDWHISTWEPRYNVAPGTSMLAIVHDAEDRAIGGQISWGMRTRQTFMINARAETVQSQPAFRPLLPHGRLIVPMNGYYEWHQTSRQPYFIHTPSEEPLWALGLYQPGPDGSHAVVLTRPASAPLEGIHPRMPVLADRNLAEAWLTRGVDRYPEVLTRLLDEAPELVPRAVDKRVNKAANEGPDLIAPISG